MSNLQMVRGRVYAAELGDYGQKYYLVVSNNRRNAALQDVLAVRLTTTKKPAIPSVVPLGAADPLSGSVVCDDVVSIWHDEALRDMGALSAPTMALVSIGLRAVFDLR